MVKKSKKVNKKQATAPKTASQTGQAKTPASTQRGEQKKAKPRKEEKKYYEAVGRRKRAIARVRLFTVSPSQSIGEGNLLINNKPYKEYFSTFVLQKTVEAPFTRLRSLNKFSGSIKVNGGGPMGQAEAIRHGIARALVLFDENFRKKLKKSGFLTRDARKKERKKFGLKGARRAPQWRKR